MPCGNDSSYLGTSVKSPLVFDCEIYRDYFLVMFRSIDTGETEHFEMYEGVNFRSTRVLELLREYTTVGFNSKRFDLPLLMMACYGET